MLLGMELNRFEMNLQYGKVLLGLDFRRYLRCQNSVL